MKRDGVNRRDALRGFAVGIGATASALWVETLLALAQEHGLEAHLLVAESAQSAGWTPAVLSARQFQTVGALVELIIPTTETPGAKTALVDRYVDAILAASAPADRDRFVRGLGWLDGRSTALFGTTFVLATPVQQTELLTRLTAGGSEAAAGVEFFTAIKGMTITGYYTTEIGLRQELGDDGRLMLSTFEGCAHPEHQ